MKGNQVKNKTGIGIYYEREPSNGRPDHWDD